MGKINQMTSVAKIASLAVLLSASAMANSDLVSKAEDVIEDAETTKDDGLADMSDPLAVFSMAGFGVTNRGINLKLAKSYDTGSPDKMAMNIIEVKGIFSDSLGWEDFSTNPSKDPTNGVDSIRVRNFSVNPTTGSGAQIDLSYDLNSEAGALSYSLLQALPPMGRFNLFPLAGLGIAVANNALQDDGTIASGYSIPGTFATLGMYGKFTVTDKIWLNYNPIWNATLSGSDLYKDHGFSGHSSVLLHEAIISYQINPRTNIRYFANWNQYLDISNGDHRIEINYQF
ncbi:MAG: hypothetical protein U9R13_04355 [Campylobacterota bacterium]|nr:hypothetical protein [Campylobacterota bacterium]